MPLVSTKVGVSEGTVYVQEVLEENLGLYVLRKYLAPSRDRMRETGREFGLYQKA